MDDTDIYTLEIFFKTVHELLVPENKAGLQVAQSHPAQDTIWPIYQASSTNCEVGSAISWQSGSWPYARSVCSISEGQS